MPSFTKPWRAVFLFCLSLSLALFAGTALARNELQHNAALGEKFPLQGDCSRHGITNADPHADLTRSTWACTGTSAKMMHIFYKEGPEECVYIDNFNDQDDEKNGDKTLRAFFVPLQTTDEWLAFKNNLPGGVQLRFGCMGMIARDPCGNEFVLPDAPASDNPLDNISIATADGHYHVDYACPRHQENGSDLQITGGCGAWQKVKEEGDCHMTEILPVGEPGPPISTGPLEKPGPVIPPGH